MNDLNRIHARAVSSTALLGIIQLDTGYRRILIEQEQATSTLSISFHSGNSFFAGYLNLSTVEARITFAFLALHTSLGPSWLLLLQIRQSLISFSTFLYLRTKFLSDYTNVCF